MPLIRNDKATPAPSAATPEAGLASESADERWNAARALATAEGVQALGPALGIETDPRVREAILTSLIRVGGSEAAAAVLSLLHSEEAAVRTGALDALRAMPEGAAGHLPALLADADADVRLLATELARGLPPGDAERLLCGLLEAENQPNVCAAAVEVLAEIGDVGSAACLSRCADRWPEETFLVFAIKIALQRIGAPPRG